MKKKLSILLAATMALSMVPTSAFAASKASVSTVVAKSGTTYEAVVNPEEGTATVNPPVVYVLPTSGTGITTGAGASDLYLDVTLNNAEWAEAILENNTGSGVDGFYPNADYVLNENSTPTDADDTYGTFAGDTSTVKGVYFLSKTKAQFVVDATVIDTTSKPVVLPMFTKIKGEGAATATVSGNGFTTETVTFATATTGGTLMTVSEVNKSATLVKMGTLLIQETTANTFVPNTTTGDLEFTLKASSYFTWTGTPSVSLLNATGTVSVLNDFDNETWTISIDNYSNTSKRQATIVVNNAELKVGSKAKEGDVKVTLNKISGSTLPTANLVVGAYTEYGVTVQAQEGEKKEIIAGYAYDYDKFEGFEANEDDNSNGRAIAIELNEEVEDSWWSGRKTVITMPANNIRIKKVVVEANDAVYNATTAMSALFTDSADDNFKSFTVDYNSTDSVTEFEGTATSSERNATIFTSGDELDTFTLSTIDVAANEKAKVRFIVYVNVPLGASEELIFTVGGSALEEDKEIKVADVIQPIKLTTTTNEQQLGYKGVKLSNVVVTETFPGALQNGTKLTFTLKDGMAFTGSDGYEVTEGGDDAFRFTSETTSATVGKATLTAGVLNITLRNESEVASQVTIKAPKIDLNRTWPEGDYKLEVAIASAGATTITSGGTAADADYLKVVTPAMDKEAQGTQQLAISAGSTDYTVGTVKATAPVAPFIDSNSRIQVPVRAITEGLGYAVNWSDADDTVTITAKGYVVQMKIGSTAVTVNGVKAFDMDTTAQIVDGYTFVPLRGLAQALNVGVTWADDTKTATFDPNVGYTAK